MLRKAGVVPGSSGLQVTESPVISPYTEVGIQESRSRDLTGSEIEPKSLEIYPVCLFISGFCFLPCWFHFQAVSSHLTDNMATCTTVKDW